MIPGESEKQFARELIRLCRALHAHVYFTHNSMHSPAGWPDLVIVKPPVIHIRELKTDTGKLTQLQSETLDLLEQCNRFTVGVWRPSQWEQIVQELKA